MTTEAPYFPPKASQEASFVLRKATPDDVPYITNSWLKGYKGSNANWNVRDSEYFHYEHKLLDYIVPRSTILVLANSANVNQIVGYIAFEMTKQDVMIFHYINVKHTFRKNGLARQMLETVLKEEKPIAVNYTYITKAGREIINSHDAECHAWRHNPYLKYAMAPPGWAK